MKTPRRFGIKSKRPSRIRGPAANLLGSKRTTRQLPPDALLGLGLQVIFINRIKHRGGNYTKLHLYSKCYLHTQDISSSSTAYNAARQPRSSRWQQADFYISKPDRIAVVLQDNVALLFIAKAGNAAVLAGGKQ